MTFPILQAPGRARARGQRRGGAAGDVARLRAPARSCSSPAGRWRWRRRCSAATRSAAGDVIAVASGGNVEARRSPRRSGGSGRGRCITRLRRARATRERPVTVSMLSVSGFVTFTGPRRGCAAGPSGSCRSRSSAARSKTTRRGHLKWARRSRQKAISSASVGRGAGLQLDEGAGGLAPFLVRAARPPRRARPRGGPCSAFSTSIEEMFSPPEMMMSLARSLSSM